MRTANQFNKQIAMKLGARHHEAGWYARPGIDLSVIRDVHGRCAAVKHDANMVAFSAHGHGAKRSNKHALGLSE
jgi:hypothetical protein